jgi:hypothetical protein
MEEGLGKLSVDGQQHVRSYTNTSPRRGTSVNIRFASVTVEEEEVQMDVLTGRLAPKPQPLLLRKKKYHVLG